LGAKLSGISEIIFGSAILVLIIFLPRGIFGSLKVLMVKKKHSERA